MAMVNEGVSLVWLVDVLAPGLSCAVKCVVLQMAAVVHSTGTWWSQVDVLPKS